MFFSMSERKILPWRAHALLECLDCSFSRELADPHLAIYRFQRTLRHAQSACSFCLAAICYVVHNIPQPSEFADSNWHSVAPTSRRTSLLQFLHILMEKRKDLASLLLHSCLCTIDSTQRLGPTASLDSPYFCPVPKTNRFVSNSSEAKLETFRKPLNRWHPNIGGSTMGYNNPTFRG